MKKLLTSQLKSIKCHQANTPSVHPKPTVVNNWNVRNDSSEVFALLRPEEHTWTERKAVANNKATVEKKCCLSTNTCYCKENRMKPKLMNRPQKCLKIDQDAEEKNGQVTSKRPLWRGSLRQCLCDGTSTRPGTSQKTYRKEGSDDLMLTEKRRDYEDYRLKEHEEFLRDLELGDHQRENEETSSSTESTERGQGDCAKVCCHFATQTDAVEKLKNFRKCHFFETHGIDGLGKDVPKHECVHEFQLDERFLPNPVNVDAFGRSRCSICSKPMEEDNARLLSTATTSKSSLRNYGKSSSSDSCFSKKSLGSYGSGLTPRRISFTGDNAKVELKASEEDVKKCACLLGKFRRPEYINSFALRFQKMRCY